MDEKLKVTEEAIRFLDRLEAENEDELTKIILAIQDAEQKAREVEYSLQEMEQKQDSNMNFFSPVGVYEDGEEKKELLEAADQLKEQLPKLIEKLEQYKQRKEQIQFIRDTFDKAIEEQKVQDTNTEQTPVLDKEQKLHFLEFQEYDRNRIAGELHDSPVQSLTGLVHKTEFCMRLLDMDTVRVKLELQTMIDAIKMIISEMRDIIYNLRPMSLDNLGLAVTIDAYCLQLKKNNNIDVEFQNRTEEPEFPSIYKVTLYRVLQEACRNVIKHAKASKVEVHFFCEDGILKLKILDNGIGFEVEKVKEASKESPNGFGLIMMKERMSLLGGNLTVCSVVGEGTTVVAEIPLPVKEGA